MINHYGGSLLTMRYKLRYIILILIILTCKASFAGEYIGYAQSIQSVRIRPEVSAKITRIHFHEGSYVNQSQTLFTLDNSEFQAEVLLRRAELAQAEAKYNGLKKYLARLKATLNRATPKSELDNTESEMLQAKAALDGAKANLRLAEIRLSHTKINAPFSGKAGKINFHTGSYVESENTLCEIVQINPIRILFALPDKDYLSLIKRNSQGLKYEIVLADDSLLSGDVTKDFEDNVMNSQTGAVNIWLKADNADNILLPGSLVRVRVSE